MKKPTLILFLTLSIIFSSAIDTTATPLWDVTNYRAEITSLVSKGIINGYPDGSFKPNQPIKRILAVQMILRDKGVTEFQAPDPNFTDLKPGDYGYLEVAAAVQLGFINGKTNPITGEKYFDPFGTLTRAQLAKILSIAYHLTMTETTAFTDVSTENWAYQYIAKLAANNITTGYEDGSFKPLQKLTRKHFAVFLTRTLANVLPYPPERLVSFSYKGITAYGVSTDLTVHVNALEKLKMEKKAIDDRTNYLQQQIQTNTEAIEPLFLASLNERSAYDQLIQEEADFRVYFTNQYNQDPNYSTVDQDRQTLATLQEQIYNHEYARLEREISRLKESNRMMQNELQTIQDQDTPVNLELEVEYQQALVNHLREHYRYD